MLIRSKAAHHGRVTPTSVESRFCVVKLASSSPRAQIVDFRYQTKPESLAKMALRLVQFLAIMLMAAIRLCARLILAYCCQPHEALLSEREGCRDRFGGG